MECMHRENERMLPLPLKKNTLNKYIKRRKITILTENVTILVKKSKCMYIVYMYYVGILTGTSSCLFGAFLSSSRLHCLLTERQMFSRYFIRLKTLLLPNILSLIVFLLVDIGCSRNGDCNGNG